MWCVELKLKSYPTAIFVGVVAGEIKLSAITAIHVNDHNTTCKISLCRTGPGPKLKSGTIALLCGTEQLISITVGLTVQLGIHKESIFFGSIFRYVPAIAPPSRIVTHHVTDSLIKYRHYLVQNPTGRRIVSGRIWNR